jgi:predicted acylesterase/phospholipase RssA
MNDNNTSRKKNTTVQRALVLQGGGSLGAYEAGVVNVLYHWIKKDLEDENNENIFDVIAGTSIGAINAAILSSHHKENSSLNAPPKQLLKFWKYLSSDSSINEFFTQYATSYWEGVRMLFPFIELPSNEALRRYMYTGVSNSIGQTHVFYPRFFSPIPTQIYNKFYDFFPLSSWWYQFDKEPLKRSIKEFAKFPISMNINPEDINISDNAQENRWPEVGKWLTEHRLDPRLLLVSVDIDEGATVTFDSYPYIGKECQICKASITKNNSSNNEINTSKEEMNGFKSPEDLIEHIDKVHGQNYQYRNLKNSKNIHWSVYDGDNDGKCLFYDGIQPEHVIASASIPKNYAFEIIDGHKFWDGGILSNTPLRELISRHITWWSDRRELEEEYKKDKFNLDFYNWKKAKDDTNIPNLNLYIVNLHPTKEGKEGDTNYHIEEDDYDMIKDRENDIRFHDKTEYDQKVATLVTDLITCIDNMGDLAIDAINQSGNKIEGLKKRFNELLNDKAFSSKRTGEKRTNQDLIKNRFNLVVEFKIERKDDLDTISNKIFDFSSDTIRRLIKEGMKDTLDYLVNKHINKHKECSPEEAREHGCSPKKTLEKLIKDLEKFIKDIGKPTLQEEEDMKKFAEEYMKKFADSLLGTLQKPLFV